MVSLINCVIATLLTVDSTPPLVLARLIMYATALRSSKLFDQSAHLEHDSEADSSFNKDRIRYRRWGFGWVIDAFRSKEICRQLTLYVLSITVLDIVGCNDIMYAYIHVS